ncbi:MAG: hypothetical protein WDA16_06475 [Candidatus Thermoplasmatota archaeon]
MDAIVQVLVGLGVVGLGVTALAFGLLNQEDAVFRHVDEVLAAPAAHMDGEFTLIGTPLPGNASTRTVMWSDAGSLRQSILTLTVTGPGSDGVSRWHIENETRVPGRTDDEASSTLHVEEWNLTGPHAVFLIRGFAEHNETPPQVWAVYRENLPEPLAPKPSQFTGHFWARLPTGPVVPSDALVWDVRTYTVGCSSKFLPPEDQAAGVDKVGS